MPHPLLDVPVTDQPPETYLRAAGEVFAEFRRSQDSGNWSYGVLVAGERFFVKTAGDPQAHHPVLSHADRVALLRNAARLAGSCRHPLLPPLLGTVETPAGPMLIYRWAEGELLGSPAAVRHRPDAPLQRFRRLPAAEVQRCLSAIFELHAQLERAGWVPSDFYDGCLIYDFATGALAVIDLDSYHQGRSTNTMGRMFGSTRFMAPEEFELGAAIDARTGVFTMGRTALVLLADGTADPGAFRGPPVAHAAALRACSPRREERFASLAAFAEAWRAALGG